MAHQPQRPCDRRIGRSPAGAGGGGSAQAQTEDLRRPRNTGSGRTIVLGTGHGGYRVTDFAPALTIAARGTIVEVKNVKRLYATKQIRDLIAEAERRGVVLEIFTNAPDPKKGDIARAMREETVRLVRIPQA
jgi:Restriction endonuclease fold toxin 7